MLPRRLPLLLAFVGGCLSTAALVVVWRDDGETRASARRAPLVDRMDDDEVEPHRVPAVAHGVESDGPGTSTKDNDDTAGPSAAESGSSVAEVLARLEARYQELATAERVTPPAQVPTAAAAAPPSEIPAPASTPPALEPAAAPLLAAHLEAPNANVHVGDVEQDVYNGDVHQGDVNQLQQIALFQYVQLLMLPPNGRVAPRGKTGRKPHAHIAITDPNNPWGFDFPPTPLVK